MAVSVWVDDLVIAGSSAEQVAKFKAKFKAKAELRLNWGWHEAETRLKISNEATSTKNQKKTEIFSKNINFF